MEILAGVHLVDDLIMSSPTGSSPVNVGLLVEGSSITMVDAGPQGGEEAVLKYIQKIGFAPSAVRRIIITHHHHDHVGALAGLVAHTGAEVWAHRGDAGFISGAIDRAPLELPEERIKAFLPNAAPDQIAALRKQYQSYAASIKPVKVDLCLSGNEELAILGGCQLIHTPGHTPGHMCLYLPERSLLIAGDLLRYDQGQLNGPVPGFTLDLAEAIKSLKQVAKLPFDHMYGYHGSFLAKEADKAVRDLTVG